jgi:hypothetical protein
MDCVTLPEYGYGVITRVLPKWSACASCVPPLLYCAIMRPAKYKYSTVVVPSGPGRVFSTATRPSNPKK